MAAHRTQNAVLMYINRKHFLDVSRKCFHKEILSADVQCHVSTEMRKTVISSCVNINFVYMGLVLYSYSCLYNHVTTLQHTSFSK